MCLLKYVKFVGKNKSPYELRSQKKSNKRKATTLIQL